MRMARSRMWPGRSGRRSTDGRFGAMSSVAVDPWGAVVGQRHAVTQLQAAVLSPVHAYLLVGQRGSGKRALARAFAAALLSEGLDGDEAERTIRLTLEGKHPDLHEFERAGPFISAAQADAIVKEASRSPVERPTKVLVLIDFHLVEEAGPKLLKTIEEPSATTVFVVLAEQVPPELVTIASRCVRIDCDVLTPDEVRDALVRSGIEPEVAGEVAAVAGADLDRARLLATDPRFGLRRDAWRAVPDTLDGNGATAYRLVAELLATIKDAQAPLDARHADELAALEARVALYGERGAGRRDLVDRQKREARRHRADELRFGFATIAARYRDAAAADPSRNGPKLAAAVEVLHEANEAIIRNPNEPLLPQSLLLRLPLLRHARSRAEPARPAATFSLPARVAQSAEQLTRNEQVKGSIPFSGSKDVVSRSSPCRRRAPARWRRSSGSGRFRARGR